MDYFNWLVDKTGRRGKNYISLLRTLHIKTFYPILNGDENRAEEGMLLRDTFGEAANDLGPCTVLEMLIALAIRIDSDIQPTIGENNVPYWFWVMIDNLGLGGMTDGRAFDLEKTEYILDRFLGREYDFDGKGGIFPVTKSVTDQRDVEIWYQMQGYLLENYAI